MTHVSADRELNRGLRSRWDTVPFLAFDLFKLFASVRLHPESRNLKLLDKETTLKNNYLD